MGSVLQSASREALGAATARLDEHIDATGAADLKRLADDLFAVVGLLDREHALRRALADPATPSEARGGLADRLFDGKIGRPALDVVSDVVKSRWSRAGDLLEGLESLARAAAFGVAEKDGSLDRVEDELFRFGRILDREPELSRLLSNTATPVDKRLGLLRDVLGRRSPRSPRHCSNRPCATRAAATSMSRPRSCPSSPRRAATATSRTSAPPCG